MPSLRKCRAEILTLMRTGGSPLLIPGDDLPTDLAEHPFVDGHDQVALLGDRDEDHRFHHFAVAVPAHQCLGADHRVVLEVDLRLVVDEQLPVLDRSPQARLQCQPASPDGRGRR
jgi:hypothetical protein